MRRYEGFFVILACFLLVFLSSARDDSLAATCSPPVKIPGYAYNPTSIQDAYDYASINLGLSNFTLLLAGDIFYENLTLDGGSVVLDGGYDCSFTTKSSTTGILGTVTISTGSAVFEGGLGVVSTDRCDFDNDGDGFTRIGSCAGSADDCNDNDPNTHPGAPEICDGIDNNCNGQVDEGIAPIDADGDGYYATGSCGGFADDCNDNNASIHPGAVDIPYDGIDQDCDGADLAFAEGSECSDCHGSAAYWNNFHANVSAPNGTCATCHAAPVSNILPGHYGKTVRTAGNNMAAGSAIVCASCHDADANNHSGGFATGNGTNLVTTKIFATWGNNTCDTCHESRASLHATATAHDNRIIDSSCGNCHTSDTSALGSPGSGTLASAADVDTLHRSDCALCHNYTGTLLNAGTVRQKIQQGLNGTQITCTHCHTDKGTNHGNFTHPVEVGPNDLSYDAPGILCSSCHVVANWSEIEGTTHNVATNGAGSCATCHNSPRQEVIDTIALRANPTHCLDCHSNKQMTPHGSVDHVAFGYVTGSATSCMTCHDPGTASNATVTVTHLNNCILCHTTVPNLQSGIPAGGGDCTTCHMGTWEVTHTAITPDHSSLVQVATTSCAGCHDNTLVSGAANTHNGCSSCHDANGALVSLAIGKTFAAGGDCATCHSGSWSAMHTVAPDHAGIVTVGATGCASCHDNTLVSAAATTHNACTSCHDANTGGLISLATGKSAPGDCTSCHTGSWDTLHATAPDHTSLVTVGTTSCAGCHNNPPPLVDPADPQVHNACASCHDANGALVSLAIGKSFAAGGNCATCHTGTWEATHTTAPSHNALVTVGTTGCADCHSDPPPLTDPVDPKVHNACSSCHNATSGALVSLAIGKTFAAGGNCATCHSGTWSATHTVAPDHTGIVTVGATGCASCHDNTLVSAATTTHNACTSCHDANTGGLISLATGKSAPGDCTSCHTGTWEATHTTAPSHNALVNVGTTACADCHSNPPPLTNAADPKVHNACSSCHSSASGALVSLASGKSFATGGDCATCHGADVQTAHVSCTTCHGEPPNGSSSPNITGAHDAHAPLGFGAVSPSCAACHNGATHYNGNTEVGISSSFDDKSSGSPAFNGSTCSNTRCHGGQTTPTWATGSINVNTQCTSCHAYGTSEYNSYSSGEHDRHLDRGVACTECHSTTKLAIGHFSNLATTTFEQTPGSTIGGAGTKITGWTDSTNRCSSSCHGWERTW